MYIIRREAFVKTINEIVKKHNKPILTKDDIPYHATLVFNAGVTKYNGKYVMIFRNDYGTWGEPRIEGTNLGLAVSDDGIDWSVKDKPILDPENLPCGINIKDKISKIYDPRLTVIDGKVYMCFAVDTAHGVCGGIASTEDFEHFEACHISVPENRNMVLFPEKIGGRYVRLERPMPVYSRGKDRFDMYMSFSPDMKYWGDMKFVMGVEDVPFANDKIGPGAPPIKTKYGWLVTIHAVDRDNSRGKNGWESKWTKFYNAGIALLDLEDPSKVIGIYDKPVISPEFPWETDEGFRTHVIFPGGMIAEETGEVKIYYGASDTVECLATADSEELAALCLGK